jgi:hypothetical protein
VQLRTDPKTSSATHLHENFFQGYLAENAARYTSREGFMDGYCAGSIDSHNYVKSDEACIDKEVFNEKLPNEFLPGLWRFGCAIPAVLAAGPGRHFASIPTVGQREECQWNGDAVRSRKDFPDECRINCNRELKISMFECIPDRPRHL